jgi:hypothetical protein
MKEYYPTNYNGKNTEIEVQKQFNWFEMWLLDKIIKYENE